LIPSEKTLVHPTWLPVRLFLMGFVSLLIAGCTKQFEFPPMGDPLPYTVRLEIAQPIKNLTADYLDSCSQPTSVPVGSQLEEALLEGANRAFKTVLYGTDISGQLPPDFILKLDFVDWSFNLDKDALYDRAPVTLQLNVIARLYDANGSLVRETEFQVAQRERVRLEQLARNCNYVIDPFIQDTATEFASKVVLDARLAAQGQHRPPSASQNAPLGAASAAPASHVSAPSSLRFKAMLLDENGNLVLERGERMRVRLDIVNTGPDHIQQATASLTGTPSILAQFPATTLSIPPLQPGETKSVEFVATVPVALELQRAELRVAVTEAGGEKAAPSQTLTLRIEPSGAGTDDVDQIPASALGFQRPQAYLISIGVGAYRDPRITARSYAAPDAKMVAQYFRALGGIPPTNIRLLQDRNAFRYDIDEALFDWLPSTMPPDALVIVYFSGQAMVNSTGEVFLLPHEAMPTLQSLLYPLKEIESALSRLKGRQVLLFFDVKMSHFKNASEGKAVTPHWSFGPGQAIGLIGGEGLTNGLEDDKHRHGLFTYYLLRGLRGDADTNRDRSVTLGELAGYVRQKVAWAAKSQFSSEQRPLIVPGLKPGDKASSLILTKLSSLSGSETP
jgi:hypothetical protein